jgi:hypothetical protein
MRGYCVNTAINIGFEVLTAVDMKFAIFWDIAPCCPYMIRRIGGKYRLHLQSRKSAEQQTSVRAGSRVFRIFLMLVSWFPALKMDAIRSSETSAHIRTTRRYIQFVSFLVSGRITLAVWF